MRHLTRVMRDIAREQGLFTLRSDMNAHVSRAVAGRGEQGHFLANSIIAADEIGLAGVDDRLNRILEDRYLVGLVAVVTPVLVFGFAEHVARIGKARHPSSL